MPRDPSQWNTTAGASKLNDFAEELIELFRAGAPTAELSRRFGTGDTNVQKWLKARGEYDRLVKCGLDECSVEFPFRPGKRYCCRLHTKRAGARNQNARPENKLKNQARNRVIKAVMRGALARPELCQRCGEPPGRAKDGRTLLQADHYMGYEPEHQLTIQWICHGCDREIEMLRKERDDRRIQAGERIGKWEVLAEEPATRRTVAKLKCRCVCGIEAMVSERHLMERRSLGCVTCRQTESRRDDTH